MHLYFFYFRYVFVRKRTLTTIYIVGASPSGKASAFGADIRWFESSRPSQDLDKTLFLQGFFFL